MNAHVKTILGLWIGGSFLANTANAVGNFSLEETVRTRFSSVLMYECESETHDLSGEQTNTLTENPPEENIFWDNPVLAISIFRSFEQDASACVRHYVYTMEAILLKFASLPESQRAQLPHLRQQLFERPIQAICVETDDINAAHFYGDIQGVLPYVEFTDTATTLIRQALAAKRPRREVILLAGIANLTDQIPRLAALRMSDEHYAALANEDGVVPALFDEVGWNARLALARLGSREDIQFCIDHIEAITDREVLVMARLGDYGYIRQPETIALLQKYLESDEIIVEGGDDVPRTGTSWYARRILAEILEGFPVTGSLAEARAWMRAQTAFKIKR